MALAQRSLGGFADRRERLWQHVVECLTRRQPGAKCRRLAGKGLIRHCRDRGFMTVDASDKRRERADVTLVRRAENALRDASKHENPNRMRGSR